MARRRGKNKRGYTNKQLFNLAHKLGLPANTPQRDIAIKLAQLTKSEMGGYRQFIKAYFANESKPEIVGIKVFKKQHQHWKFTPLRPSVEHLPDGLDKEKRELNWQYANSDTFLQSYEWRKVRMQAIKKYGAKCQCCGATPKDGATINVDHIKPRKIFPQLALSLDNLQVLCGDCNHGKGNWDMTDWREKQEIN